MAMDTQCIPLPWVQEHRLKKIGLYYVDDIDLVRQASTFGIRRSRVNNGQTTIAGVDHPTCNDAQGKENKV